MKHDLVHIEVYYFYVNNNNKKCTSCCSKNNLSSRIYFTMFPYGFFLLFTPVSSVEIGLHIIWSTYFLVCRGKGGTFAHGTMGHIPKDSQKDSLKQNKEFSLKRRKPQYIDSLICGQNHPKIMIELVIFCQKCPWIHHFWWRIQSNLLSLLITVFKLVKLSWKWVWIGYHFKKSLKKSKKEKSYNKSFVWMYPTIPYVTHC